MDVRVPPLSPRACTPVSMIETASFKAAIQISRLFFVAGSAITGRYRKYGSPS